MKRTIGSLLFYGRFLTSFSAIGFRRRASGWDALEPDFHDQTWVVTGATGGIGKAITLRAAQAGASVIAVGRSTEKLDQLIDSAPAVEAITTAQADLASIPEIGRLADFIQSLQSPVDVLVNNVGVLLDDLTTTTEGHQTAFATNILGHYELSRLLQERGLFSASACIIEMSSGGMYGAPLQLVPMATTRPDEYDGMEAYAMHKRAQVALAEGLNRQWGDSGPSCYVMHPGWVDTEGVRTALPLFRKTLKSVLRDADQGADTAIWLAENRPRREPHGIWFDRERRDEHAFSFTRKSAHGPADLLQFLRDQFH